MTAGDRLDVFFKVGPLGIGDFYDGDFQIEILSVQDCWVRKCPKRRPILHRDSFFLQTPTNAEQHDRKPKAIYEEVPSSSSDASTLCFQSSYAQ